VGAGRLPDFVVIGVMKAGSTTLFRWLDEHPGVRMPADKEPEFFADDRAWRRGPEWYASLFAGIPAHLTTGEASVAYADPRTAGVVVPRLQQTLPDARLVCLLRDPVARLRSHYRHEVLRGRESRTLPDALTDAESPYVRRSSYGRVLRPWLDAATGPRLHVATAEELFTDESAWSDLLRHLDLAPMPVPHSVHNATEGKAGFSPLMRRLWDAGVIDRLPRPRRPARDLARRLLLRAPDPELMASAGATLDAGLRRRLGAEVALAEELLGRRLPYDLPRR
jgi:Sulfotransferase domain